MQQFESQFLFHPPKPLPLVDGSQWPDLETTNLWIDGSLHVIVIRPKQVEEKGKEEEKKNFWCLFFHGNGMLAEECIFLVEPLVKRQNWSLVIVEYRGYGQSSAAVPSLCKDSILADGELAVRFLTETCHVDPQQIIVWGYSLGGAVACHVASMVTFHCLVLVGTFSSLLEVAKDRGMCNWFTGPLLSIYYNASENLDTCHRLKNVKIPVIVAHALDDDIVPPASAQRNWESISHKSRWLLWSRSGSHSFFPMYPWFLNFIENVPKPQLLTPSSLAHPSSSPSSLSFGDNAHACFRPCFGACDT